MITGKVIAFSEKETVTTSNGQREKRKLFIDCTRYDPYTGQRDEFENTPLIEFGGKSLEKLDALITQGLKKDDVVTIKFAVQGIKYTKDGKQNIFTTIRPYDIELRVLNQQVQQQPQQAQAQAPQQMPVQPTEPDLPF